LTFGALPELVKTHLICAAGKTFAAGIVKSKPVRAPKVAGFPVTAEFVSEQLTLASVKNKLEFSDICTSELRELMAIGIGAAGAAVPALDVVMEDGVEAKFETAKLKAPPAAPVVSFCKATVAGIAVLIMLQAICAAGKTLAAGTVKTEPLKLPKVAGFPVKLEFASLQLADVAAKLGLALSVISICVLPAKT
jgi:hypothetical protein